MAFLTWINMLFVLRAVMANLFVACLPENSY